MRRALPRGSALETAAAELLAYLDAAAPVPGAAAEPARGNAPETPLPLPAELSVPNAAEIAWRTDTGSAADAAVREPGQSGGQMLPTVSAQADAETPEKDAVRAALFDAPAGTQQTMDDISEFFRRDSRRYDNGFAGGNGI